MFKGHEKGPTSSRISKVMCNRCGRRHHISLCEVQVTQQLSSDSQRSPDAHSITTSPSTLHVGTGGRVALQTVRAVITSGQSVVLRG